AQALAPRPVAPARALAPRLSADRAGAEGARVRPGAGRRARRPRRRLERRPRGPRHRRLPARPAGAPRRARAADGHLVLNPHQEDAMPITSRYLFTASMAVDPAKDALFNQAHDPARLPPILKGPGLL